MSNHILALKAEELDHLNPEKSIHTPTDLGQINFGHVIERKPFGETPDCGYIHPITYVYITHNDETFTYRRTVKGGESRLHGAMSLGVGGHVDIEFPFDIFDFHPAELIENTVLRELEEELQLSHTSESSDFTSVDFKFYLHDKKNEVNALHLGMVFHAILSDDGYAKLMENINAGKIEDHLCEAKFYTTSSLLTDCYGECESWSQTLINEFEGQ